MTCSVLDANCKIVICLLLSGRNSACRELIEQRIVVIDMAKTQMVDARTTPVQEFPLDAGLGERLD